MEDKSESQAWFWNEDWQAGERAAEAELKAGRFTEYANAAEQTRQEILRELAGMDDHCDCPA